MDNNLETATLAGGCFWCTEAIFKRLKGVESALPGYSGGDIANPSYEAVCAGTTGHAEAIQIKFDPNIISYHKLLEIFFALHDPTTIDRQGNDVGPQYRSVIFYHDDDQKKIAQRLKAKINKSGKYQFPVVTRVEPFDKFYPADETHRDFYEKNPDQPYCQIIIDPKITKLYRDFKGETK